MIEHHKENYEAEVKAVEAAREPSPAPHSSSVSSGSDSEFSASDGSSYFSSDDLMGVDTELATPLSMPSVDFDADMDVVYVDDIHDLSDTEYVTSPQYVLFNYRLVEQLILMNLSLSPDRLADLH